MARGARLTGEERRIQIMEAALNVFAAKGFNGARTKEIAREAGVSETLIFQHFKTKEELYFRSVHALFNHHPLLDELEEKLAQEDDEAVFLTAALHIIHHGLDDPRIIRLGLFNGLEGSDLAHRAHQERFMESGERLPEDESDKEGVAALLLTLVEGVIFMDGVDRSDIADAAVERLFSAS